MGGVVSRANSNNNSNNNSFRVPPLPSCKDIMPVLEKGMDLSPNNANCDRAARLDASQTHAVVNGSDCPPVSVTIINNFGSGQIYLNNAPIEPPPKKQDPPNAPFASISSGFSNSDNILNFDLINTLGFDIKKI